MAQVLVGRTPPGRRPLPTRSPHSQASPERTTRDGWRWRCWSHLSTGLGLATQGLRGCKASSASSSLGLRSQCWGPDFKPRQQLGHVSEGSLAEQLQAPPLLAHLQVQQLLQHLLPLCLLRQPHPLQLLCVQPQQRPACEGGKRRGVEPRSPSTGLQEQRQRQRKT